MIPPRRYDRGMPSAFSPAPSITRRQGGRALLLLAGLLPPVGALSQTRRADPNPDATIEIEEVRVGLLVLGGTLGGGRLRFRGTEHAFSVRGLEFGSVGVSSLSARGEVFRLSRLEDFAGRYTLETLPQPPGGAGGPEQLRLHNEAGVAIRLRSDRDGVVLRVTDAGLEIQLRR